MRCPHCNKDGKSTVLESRPAQGSTWRRRLCKLCFNTYVSCETAEPGMKMPPETQSKFRIKDKNLKPEQRR